MKRRMAKAQVKRAQDAAARRMEAAEGRAREDLQTWVVVPPSHRLVAPACVLKV